MQQKALVKVLVAVGLSSLLAACGGGGGNSTTQPAGAVSTASSTGTVSVSLTDGPSDTFNHVWVTVKAVAFHTSADSVWNSADATWQTTTLANPVTIDLAQLNNGALSQVFSGMKLPVGTYKQIRFFFASADDSLTSSAQAIQDHETTPAALQWNDQVEYTDSSTGLVSEAPLEIANPTQGIQLNGNFAVTAGSTLSLAVDFDLARIIVPFKHDSKQAFTMRPNLRYFDINQSGAIAGQIDPTKICQGAPAATCAYNLIVHAEVLSGDGSRHVGVRSTSIDPTSGKFTLYPVSLKDASGKALNYDIVIRGRNMETMVITGVTPAGTATSGATQVQSTAIVPTINASEYGAQFATALAPLTSGYAVFQQTLPVAGVASPVPYEIRWNNTNPFTGKFNAPFMLENAAVHVASFNGGNALTFATVTPTEGSGGYTVATNEIAYYDPSNSAAITSANASSFTPPTPILHSGVQNGSVSGTLSVSNASAYDHATLVLSRYASIVTTQDVSSLLATNGGTFTVSNLPAGSATSTVPGAYYYGYLRLWKAGAGVKKAKIVPISGMIDLRGTNSVTGFNVTISGS